MERKTGTERIKVNGKEYLAIYYYGEVTYRPVEMISEVESFYTLDGDS